MSYLGQLWRSLARRAGSSALILLLCALGVFLSTTIVAVVQTVLLSPLPYRDSERLVIPWCVAESFGIDRYPFSWDNYRDYRDGIEAFEELAATRNIQVTLEGATRPTSVEGVRVTENFFSVLGVSPLLGRLFESTADGASESGVAVVSYGLWQRVFGGAPDVVGRSIRLDGKPHTVVGVLPSEVRFPRNDSEVFVPLVIRDPPETVRAFHFLRLVGRLREGRTLREAEVEMQTLAAKLAESYPDANRNLGARLVPMREEIVGTTRRSLETLFSAVQVLFFIAWANVAVLLVVRGMARRSELQLRAALGASRLRLLALLVGEAAVLAGLGCLVGLGAGVFAADGLRQVDPSILPRASEIRFSSQLLLWAFGTTGLGVLLFAGLPAWVATRSGEHDFVSSRSTDRRASRLGTALVAAQIALVIPLLIASTMQLRSVQALREVETGFRVERALAAGVSLPTSQFLPPEQNRYVERATEILERLPGVRSVAAMSHVPFESRQASIVTFRPDQEGQSGLPNAQYRVISPGLLQTLGIPLVAGREFERGDDASDRRLVILDEKLAQILFPDRDAIGQKVRLGNEKVDWEVVGVARPALLVRLDEEPDLTVYVPILQNRFPGAMATPRFIVRTDASPDALSASVSDALSSVDPDQAVLEVRPLALQIEDWLGERRVVTALLWVIGGAALLLAGAGVYATLAFSVGRRLREMAIRSALGASARRVARTIIVDGLKPGLVGAAAGLGLGLVVGRLLVGMLYGVPSVDLPSLLTATVLLLVVTLLACVAPALRATRESPARLLREDELG